MRKNWLRKNRNRKKTAMLVAAVLVVFITTYSLILPALTVEKSSASEAGIVLDQGAANSSGITADSVEKETAQNASTDTSASDFNGTYLEDEKKGAADTNGQPAETTGNQAPAAASGNASISGNASTSGNAADNHTSATVSDKASGEAAPAASAPAASAAGGSGTDRNAMPAQDFEKELKKEKLIVSVKAEEGALPAGTEMKVKAVSDKETIKKITEAAEKEAGDDRQIGDIQAVDITFLHDGEEIEPAKDICVTISSDIIKESDEQIIIHVNDEDSDRVSDSKKGKAEVIKTLTDKELEEKDITPAENEIVFEAGQFSVYAVVGTTIEKTVLASDGKDYKVTVTYGPEAGIPEGAELEVSQVLPEDEDGTEGFSVYGMGYEEYVSYTENALAENEKVTFARFFDIEIVKDGQEIQPQQPVVVKIELAEELNDGVRAVHFGDEVEILDTVLVDAQKFDNAVQFEANGFSVYGVFVSTSNRQLSDGEQYIIYVDTGYAIGANQNLRSVQVTDVGGLVESSNDNVFWTAEYVRRHDNGYAMYRLYYVSNGTRYYLTRTGTNGLTVSTNQQNGYSQLWSTWDVYMHNAEGGNYQANNYNNFVCYNNGAFSMTDYNGKSVIRFAKKEDNSSNKVKVYVYVAAYDLEGNQFKDNPEFLELLGISGDTVDGNGYFPVGEIELDRSFFTGKTNAYTDGSPLITSANDWSAVLAALGELNTSTLVDQNGVAYSENKGNNVGDYMSQAVGDINGSWGSKRTALFHWPTTNWSYGFSDQTVTYHLDLRFQTNKVTFITGNNGITSGASKDGTTVDVRAYILGSEIQQPRNLVIPAGYRLVGYYNDPDFTTPWNKIGTPITQDEVAYIKITPQNNVILHYQPVPEAGGTVSVDAEGVNPETGVPGGSTAKANPGYHFVGWYADEACEQLLSKDATYKPTKNSSQRWVDGTTYYAKFEEDTVTLTFVAEENINYVELVTDSGEVISVTGDKTKEMKVTINKVTGPAVTVRGVAANGYVVKEWTINTEKKSLTTSPTITTQVTDDKEATTFWTERTYHVWAETAKKVNVTKQVEIVGTVKAANVDTDVYFALKSKATGEFLKNNDGTIWLEHVKVTDGVPQSSATVTFDGVQSGTYDVWEVDSTGTPLSQGMTVVENDSSGKPILLTTIRTIHGNSTSNNVTVNEEQKEDSLTIINTYSHPQETFDFITTKQWYSTVNTYNDETKMDINPPAGAWAELSLYIQGQEDGAPIRTIRLDGTVDSEGEYEAWKAKFDGVASVDADGEVIQYIVKETDYSKELNGNHYYAVKDSVMTSNQTIKNAIVKGSIHIVKEIDVAPKNEAMKEDVTKALNNLKVRVTGPYQYDQEFTFTDKSDPYNLSLTISDLPAGTYTVSESGYENLITGRKWNPTLSWIQSGNAARQTGKTSATVEIKEDGTVDVKMHNDYTKYDISATKVWDDKGLENVDHPAVSLTLYRIDGTGNRSVVGTKIIGANQTGDGLTVKWEQQEQQDQQYTYEIEEALVEGYTCSSIVGDMFSGFSVTNTKAAMLKILKIDQTGNPLEGATFTLTGGDISETGLTSKKRTIKVGEDDVTEALIYENKAMPVGTYKLSETGTPAGYNSLEGEVEIKIKNEGSDMAVSAKINGVEMSDNQISRDTETGEWTIKIMNSSGVELPPTGGSGTRVLYLLGAILITLAGVGLVMKKRHRNIT